VALAVDEMEEEVRLYKMAHAPFACPLPVLFSRITFRLVGIACLVPGILPFLSPFLILLTRGGGLPPFRMTLIFSHHHYHLCVCVSLVSSCLSCLVPCVLSCALPCALPFPTVCAGRAVLDLHRRVGGGRARQGAGLPPLLPLGLPRPVARPLQALPALQALRHRGPAAAAAAAAQLHPCLGRPRLRP